MNLAVHQVGDRTTQKNYFKFFLAHRTLTTSIPRNMNPKNKKKGKF